MVSEPAERRLAAILSADVAGYSRLMAADEDATVRRLATHREEVELLLRQHRGRLVDFTGDNFLAEFPSALDAVQAAVEIQRVLGALNADVPAEARIEFRIGVHLGDVRVENGRLFGDGVNIAARLEQHAAPGGLCLSAAVHEQVASRVALVYQDLGALALKNLPQPVRAWAARLPTAPAAPGPSRRGLRRAAIGAAATLALAALALWASWPAPLGWLLDRMGITAQPENPALPDQPSLVVLPFANLSGDPAQEYFSDGITDELTTAFAQVPGLLVISRGSAFAYKGKPTRIEDVGRELGVRYVLEGSVRRAGEQLRLSAQLSDPTRGFQIWSQRYDRDITDIFAVQSDITASIIAAVGVEIRGEVRERIRARPAETIGAYDAFLAAGAAGRGLTRRGNLESRRLYERTLELDLDYAPALAGLAGTYLNESVWCWKFDRSECARAVELLHRALALDPSLAAAHSTLGLAELERRRPAEAIPHFERAIELAPSYEAARLGLSAAQSRNGQPLAGLRSLQTALRLTPRPQPGALSIQTLAQERAGRHEDALRTAESVRATYPEQLPVVLWLAAKYEMSGRHDEAQAVVADVRQVNPELRADQVGECIRALSSDEIPVFRESLRRAGLP